MISEWILPGDNYVGARLPNCRRAEALPQAEARHQLLKVDLTDVAATAAAVRQADPDLVLLLAAESKVSGTFQLLQALRAHWEGLSAGSQAGFCFHHTSTDEEFGSLEATGRFSETTPYDPLAISREADSALWRWAECARLALCGRSRGFAADLLPAGAPHSRLITPLMDSPGHDRRYAIDPTWISSEQGLAGVR